METLTKLEPQLDPNQASHAAIIHISAFSSLIGIPLGSIVGPLITWLIWRDQSKFADENGKEAINFNLSILLYQFLVVTIGLIMFLSPILNISATDKSGQLGMILSLPGLWLFLTGIGLLSLIRIVLVLVATIKAGNGEMFRYPLTIRLIK